jgi:hypothetical protein
MRWWPKVKMAESHLLAVVRSLSFEDNPDNHLSGLTDSAWRDLLRVTDRSQLTLPLAAHSPASFPQWVRDRLESDLSNNAIRHERTMQRYREIQEALTSRGLRFAVLKGFTQYPLYCTDLRARPQYDLDLYCPESDIAAAYQAIIALGYEPFRQKTGTPVDHLSPLIRKTGWRPRGDYYDPDMPLTIEMHFRFWDNDTECFDVQGAETLWERRRLREISGLEVPVLHPNDALSYTAWHLVRHLLRGDLRAYHVYELANFLHQTADHNDFWRKWRNGQLSPIVESMAFRLAMDWFHCAANPAVTRLAHSLPHTVERWFTMFGFSPLYSVEKPNKDELFLHLALVQGYRKRLKIARRRLFPFRFEPVVVDAHVPAPGTALRWKRRVFGFWFMAKRMLHHLRTFLPVIQSGLRWRMEPASHRIPRAGTALQ